MNLQEKKRAIIKKIEESTSDDFISKIYNNINQANSWDETDDGKDLIIKLLEKSQQSAKEGKTHSFDNVLNEVRDKYGLK
ncbi:hypothetical protein FLGE108171_07515 [Flavobacterium gelidilacus]|uniref:hypothetical protein n=1 Tax=Flavobacterium gelidilacus TaxID=206041 RepID=UPI000406511F|nr:hypothetical protein [Flavobacterium gelidilacus]